MRLVSAKGANVNATGADGTTAIMYAAANGDVELVRALIKAGANVKLENQFGTSALTEAAIIGSAPIIDALLKAGADPNFKNPDGETPLMAAARSGKVDAAKVACWMREPTSTRRKPGADNRAIMWAAAQSQADMVKFLASKDANLNDHGKIRQWERKIIAGTSPEGHEQGRLYRAALCRAGRLRGLRSEPAGRRRRSRFRRSGPRDAAASRAG